MGAGLGGGEAVGSGERLEGDAAGRAAHGGSEGGGIELPDVEGGLGELVGEESEAGDVSRPPPPGHVEPLQGDLKRVPRLRGVDEDGSVDGVHLGEI